MLYRRMALVGCLAMGLVALGQEAGTQPATQAGGGAGTQAAGTQKSEAGSQPSSQPAGTQAGREVVFKDVVYGKAGEGELRLDVYLPKGEVARGWPVVVRVGAKREGLAGLGEGLLEKGVAVVSAEYLVEGAERGVRFGAFPRDVESVGAALKFVRENAEKYGLDAGRVGLMGSGDGATLAAIAGMKSEGDGRGVQAVCLFGGTTDFRNAELYGDETVNLPGSAGWQMFGTNLKMTPDLAREASAINFVRPTSPKVLMVTLQSDANRAMHLIFAETLKRAGVASALYEQDKGAGLGEKKVDEAKLTATVVEFFKDTLREGGKREQISVQQEVEILAKAGLYKQARRLIEEEMGKAKGERGGEEREMWMKELRAVAVKQQEPAIERLVEVKKNKAKYVSAVGDQRILWTLREVLTDPERIGEYDVEGTIAQGDFDLRAGALGMVEELNRFVVQADWGAAERQIAEMKRKAEAGMVDKGVVAAYVKRYGELRAMPDRKWPAEAKKLAFVTAYGQDLYGYWFDLRAGGTTQRFRYIAPGKFVMGSAKEEWGRLPGEPLLEEMIVAKGFWMMEGEVTQELWDGVMGAEGNRSKFRGGRLPVENVSYAHAVNFAGKLGVDARLPTEVEWEYACRAGSRYMYSGTGRLSDHAWFWDEKRDVIGAESVRIVHEVDAEVTGDARSTHEVKGKLPNAWGLYDMQGNVWEWCKESGVGGGVLVRDMHPVRGGSWTSIPQSCRAARAAWFDVEHQSWNVGLRVVISAEGK